MKGIKKIVIAIRNPAKKQRHAKLLSSLAQEVVGLNDFEITDKPDESGETAEANAEIKARFYAEKTGVAAFSEDEALYVDFLPESKQPGVHVRRVRGQDEATDEELLNYWEELIAQTPKEKKNRPLAYCLLPGFSRRNHPDSFYGPAPKLFLSLIRGAYPRLAYEQLGRTCAV
ncbi:MAG: non-canonical purine NTP pyrophosphatase [bacterium]